MRLLLAESVPSRLRRSLPKHEVHTVVEVGWSGVKNGKLLALGAVGYDALITVDKNPQYQQNLATLPVAVILLTRYRMSYMCCCTWFQTLKWPCLH